ncbi:UDP-glucuronosyltransferase 1A1-like [Physella acuta]|uniref:UDP-glucuronosyltransferase 1A1-like n=1 Tax=Physella acuta TaxID=109671 RepID=UPI0027DC5430|nr:UDP-glucuronosyltransferase 1A1-like [Physella acuta]
MYVLKLLTLCFCVLYLTHTESKKIVMFPGLIRSYFLYHANIGQALIDLGHEVWICVPEFLSGKNLIKYKDIKILKFGETLGNMEAQVFKSAKIYDNFWDGNEISINELLTTAVEFKKFINLVLTDQTFIDNVKNIGPDLLVIDEFLYLRNIFVLPYKLDIPFVVVGCFHELILHRVPFSPAVEPKLPEKINNRMSFMQRLSLTIRTIAELIYDPFTDNDIVTRIAPEKPYTTISDIILKAEIFIVELDHILDYPRPMLPNTKLIGGSSVSEPKHLIGEFKEFVEKSTNGVVVVSFGGNDIPFPSHIINKMVSAFKQLDLNVVWRANVTSPALDKLMTSLWIPQNDLLGHPKTKVFVSHCGKNGQYEALYNAVPILCFPIYGDQFYNSERIRVKGFGLVGDIRKISEEELITTIKELAFDNKCKRHIEKASILFKELYKVPSKEAAYWIDHVMKYGGDYMRSSGQEMPLYQFLLLDVIAFIAAVLSGVVVIFILIARLCYRRVFTKRTVKKKKE